MWKGTPTDDNHGKRKKEKLFCQDKRKQHLGRNCADDFGGFEMNVDVVLVAGMLIGFWSMVVFIVRWFL
jgi:hypothetical protein